MIQLNNEAWYVFSLYFYINNDNSFSRFFDLGDDYIIKVDGTSLMLPNQHDAITFNTDYTDRKNITVLNSQVEEISAEDTSYVYLLH